jgi:hypothetical protein
VTVRTMFGGFASSVSCSHAKSVKSRLPNSTELGAQSRLLRFFATAELRHRVRVALRTRSAISVSSVEKQLCRFALDKRRGDVVPTIADGYAAIVDVINREGGK